MLTELKVIFLGSIKFSINYDNANTKDSRPVADCKILRKFCLKINFFKLAQTYYIPVG